MLVVLNAYIHTRTQSCSTLALFELQSVVCPLNQQRIVVVQLLSGVRLCDPMDCSTSGFPVLHYLLEFTQTHVHWLNDAIHLILCLPLFFLPASFPVSASFSMSWLFTSGGQSIEASALNSSSELSPGPSCYSVGYWRAGLEEVTLESKGNKSITSLPDRHWSHILGRPTLTP